MIQLLTQAADENNEDLGQSGIQIHSLHVKDVIHYHRDSLRHSLPTDDAPSYTTHC